MDLALRLLDYALVAVFGVALSAEFAGVAGRRHAAAKLVAFTAADMLVQLLCLMAFGFETTFELYPLVVHAPLIVFLTAAFHQSPAHATVGVLSAYLCCQIPRWIAETVLLVSGSPLARDLVHLAALAVTYVLLHRYAVGPLQKLLASSRRATLLLGIVPLLYYLFDYGSTVYSDLLYSGNAFAVQLMPSLVACAYFFFLLVYHSKAEAHENARHEQELLALQLSQSETEYETLRCMQDQARMYRHDVRHHLSLLLGFAEEGDLQKIKAYICGIEQDLDTFTPRRCCRNDVVDLLLSHFDSRARSAGVKLSITADLPEALPFDDRDLCSLLSNGLENAVCAASRVCDPARRVVEVKLSFRQKNLLMSIQNPFEGTVEFEDGLPVADRAGHGFGTRSIASVTKSYGGRASFSADDGVFAVRAMLPTRE